MADKRVLPRPPEVRAPSPHDETTERRLKEQLDSAHARLAAAEGECHTLRQAIAPLKEGKQADILERNRLLAALADRDEAVLRLEQQLRERESQLVAVTQAKTEDAKQKMQGKTMQELQSELERIRALFLEKSEKVTAQGSRILELESVNEALLKKIVVLQEELNSTGVGQLPLDQSSASLMSTPRRPTIQRVEKLISGNYKSSPSGGNISSRLEIMSGGGVNMSLVQKDHEHLQAVVRVKFANAVNEMVACASKDGTISILKLNGDSLERLHLLKGHLDAVWDIEWSLSSERLLSASRDGSARIWNIDNGECIRMIDIGGGDVHCCRFHPRNNNIFVVGTENGMVCVCNMSTGKVISHLELKAPVTALCFDSFGTSLFVGFASGVLQWFHLEENSGNMKRCCVLAVASPYISSLSYMRRNLGGEVEALLLTSYADDKVVVYRVDTQMGVLSEVKTVDIKHSYGSLIKSNFGPNNQFVSGSEDKDILFFDLRSAASTPVGRVHGHASTVIDISWSCNGDLLASSDEGGLILFWRRMDS